MTKTTCFDVFEVTSKKYDTGKLYDEASTIMEQKLSQIDGVGQEVVGGLRCPRCG